MREMGKALREPATTAPCAPPRRRSPPRIDDVSLCGARGVLISSTGGKDLTLYEVDEAATRIREEVDAEANIIVGATFDESLVGIIRVSWWRPASTSMRPTMSARPGLRTPFRRATRRRRRKLACNRLICHRITAAGGWPMRSSPPADVIVTTAARPPGLG
jgi:hypothetical protein